MCSFDGDSIHHGSVNNTVIQPDNVTTYTPMNRAYSERKETGVSDNGRRVLPLCTIQHGIVQVKNTLNAEGKSVTMHGDAENARKENARLENETSGMEKQDLNLQQKNTMVQKNAALDNLVSKCKGVKYAKRNFWLHTFSFGLHIFVEVGGVKNLP